MRAGVILLLLGLFGLLLAIGGLGLTFSDQQLAGAVALASLPVPIYVGLALCIDRYEPEPPALLLGAFLWGASISALFSLIVNEQNHFYFYRILGDHRAASDLSAIFSAPPVEELFKALGLLLLYLWRSKDFDGVVDGVIYATMIALGFAMAENVYYYGVAIETQETRQLFLLRGIFMAFTHPLFTSMTGAGLGWAVENPQRGWRWLAPLFGLVVAVTLHFLWNLSATVNVYLWYGTCLLIMAPSALALGFMLKDALAREGQCLRHYLRHDLPSSELAIVSSIGGRISFSLTALLRQGPRDWKRSEDFLQVASQLAFLRRGRAERGQDASGEEEEGLRTRMFALKSQLSRRFARPH